MRRFVVWAPALLLALAPRASAQTFVPVASPAIASHVAFSTGATWVDLDQDGDLDVYVTTGFSTNNGNVIYRNDGGSFVRITGVPAVLDSADTACSTWADIDNDGDVDGFLSNLVAQGGMLFRGQGGGAFVLDTGSGLGGAALKGTGCAWGDYDNDGFVDLIIAALNGQGGITTGNRLFHNDGDGTFTEVTTGPEVTTLDTHHHPTWSDFDHDGDLDLFFATGSVGSTDTDRMYRNQLVETGIAEFVAITTSPIATDARDSQTLTWIDYDNDGDFDLFAVNYTSVPCQLYRNDGAGTFTKLTTGTLVTDLGAAHGATWGDFDDDGDLDVYVVRDSHQSNRYYRNDGGDTFTRIAVGDFVNEALSNYGVAAGDYDQDGDLDLFLPTARSEAASVLYRNDLANGNHWLTVRCQGTVSNRSAIGTKVRVRSVIGGVPRWQMREILAGTSYGGHNALEAHFGLAAATVADTVRVEWPSGIVQTLVLVPANQRLDVIETLPVGVEAPGLPSAALALSCRPDPFHERTTVFVRMAKAARASVEVFDSAGRLVSTLHRGPLPQGTHTFVVPSTTLHGPGIYFVRLDDGRARVTRRLVRL